MNCLPTSPFRNVGPWRKAGFTLVEVITAMAVLTIMLLMLGQILVVVNQAWISGQRSVNNFTKSRSMLDIFASDIQAGIFNDDVAAFPSTPAPPAPNPGPNIEFYTKRQGIPTNGGAARSVSLVQYAYSTDQSTSSSISTLQRGDMAVTWSPPASQISFGFTNSSNPPFNGNTTTFRDMAPGVVDYRVLFVYADGTVSTTYPSTSAAAPALCSVSLTLAVVDDKTLLLLSTGQVTKLRSALDNAVSGTRSVKADWEAYLNSSMSWNSYPKSLAPGLKIFERYVSIPSF